MNNCKASILRQNSVTKASRKLVAVGKLQAIESDDVFEKVKYENLGGKDRDKDKNDISDDDLPLLRLRKPLGDQTNKMKYDEVYSDNSIEEEEQPSTSKPVAGVKTGTYILVSISGESNKRTAAKYEHKYVAVCQGDIEADGQQGSLPSITTIQRNIFTQEDSFIESQVRFDKLKDFLEKRNYPKNIWISEDQTGITGRIQYDSKTNNIVGFVLPLRDGLPITNYFQAKTASEIELIFLTQTKSNYLLMIMAQPLVPNAPAFSLCAFGSNNKFTHKDVQRRWQILEQLAAENGIKIMGFSSDGDSRLLKTMRIKSQLPYTKTENQDRNQDKTPSDVIDPDWFQANLHNEGSFCVQDTVHIGTRLRTRFLKPSIMLPIGKCIISPTYLTSLMNMVTKDKHLLCPSDLKGDDKMNYDSVERICAPQVLELLSEKLPDSKGTAAYLKIVRYVLDSFLSKDLTPLERVEEIWYAVFFLRIWRYWIKIMKYSVVDNFITLSTYISIELNAHALILVIKKMYNDNPSEFCPWIMSSQPCEKIFRSIRSMTSTFSTVTNYSMLDILGRLTRIQAINEITCDTEIEMERGHVSISECNPQHSANIAADRVADIDELDNETISDLHILRSLDAEDSLNFKDLSDKFSEKDDDFFERSSYVKVYHKNKRIVIRKSTLCWFLSNKDKKMSSDRLQRVKFLVKPKQDIVNNTRESEQLVEEKESLKIGEWVIFSINSKLDKTVSEPLSFLKVGKILSFKYLNKKTKKQQEYSLDSAPVLSKTDPNVGVLCQWFLLNQEGEMTLDDGFQLFHKIGLYICSIGAPTLKGNYLSIDKENVQHIVDRYLEIRNGNKKNDDSSDSDVDIIYNDSDDNLEFSNQSEHEESPPSQALPELEKYYAIFYEDNFYIGRAIRHSQTNVSRFKFLKWDLDRLIWPKNGTFKFPREENSKLGKISSNGSSTCEDVIKSITNEEILECLKEAHSQAEKDADSLGVILKEHSRGTSLDVHITSVEEESYSTEGEDKNGTISMNGIEEELSDSEYNRDLLDTHELPEFETLDLKDFSQTVHDPKIDSSFLKVILKNGKELVVRKSSLCWLFSNKQSRLSSDRIYRVRGTGSSTSSNPLATPKDKMKRKQKKKIIPKNTIDQKQSKKSLSTKNIKKRTSNKTDTDATDTETDTSFDFESESEFENESFEELTADRAADETRSSPDRVVLTEEKYYAVYYDNQFYLGRILKIFNDSNWCTVKFLQKNLEAYIWPKKDDIQDIETNFVIYGPIDLNGIGPFQLNRTTEVAIKKIYRDFRKTVQSE
ncbi:unnamed protein product [Phaedon cochleariae]|uniref:Uncharacterized protein n=1 Tax=Phaedon cochleariae TaxID=80249 RepID=A0A9N9SCK9_PHACE|nr:unnamed protein product [Phaedon cochleariae]